jgi:N-methylhydantoinase A
LYENKYGKGSALRDAGIEMTQFRLTASGIIEPPEMILEPTSGEDAADALLGQRNIYVNGRNGFNVANIYDFEKLLPGNLIPGPAVIHTPITTIVIQDGQCGEMDGYKNIVIEVN